jgi:hypothetical protein
MTRSRAAVVVVIIAVSGTSALAQKTDVVTLNNGDRITCEIQQLDRGRLQIKTDDAGTIEIEWEAIASLSAAHEFEVTTRDEQRVVGSLTPAPGRSIVVTASDGTTESFAMDAITEIVQIGKSFWTKLDGSFNAGFSYTRSSGVAQTNLSGDTAYRRPSFTMKLSGAATVTATSGDDDPQRSNQGTLDFSYARYVGRRAYISGGGSLETNESLGLELRTQAAGLFGRRLVNTNHAQLETGAGLAVNNERGVDTPSTQNIEGIVALTSSYYTYNRPKTNFDADIKYYPSFSNWGRQRLHVSVAVNRELWRDFHVGVNTYDTYDSAPPQADAAHNDIGVTASIGWSFGR